ncbi:MAG: hypothetical protein S4CHLAM20_14670 [Chlamydiia bacterium]|nr:hypothetical protein [Chlamydiia bacterium]
MYDEINLFLNCTFIIITVWNIIDIQHKINKLSTMSAMGILNFDSRLKEIEKVLAIPPKYEDDSSSSTSMVEEREEGEESEEPIDEAEQIPYTPSPPYGQTPSLAPFDLDGID